MASRRAPEPVLEIFPPDPSSAAPPSARPSREPTVGGDQGTVRLPSGRSLQWQAHDDGTELVRIHGVGGEIELDVTLTESGPRLRFKAVDLSLETHGKVQVDCDEFRVRATSAIVHETPGDKAESVGGNAVTVVQGDVRTAGRTVGIQAIRGDVRVKANDDVKLTGERVLLNC